MLGVILRDKQNEIIAPVSQFQPPEDVRNFTLAVIEDYAVGWGIMNRTFAEFNDMSLLLRMDKDQKVFNSYVMPLSDDPDDSWRWNGVRPITRNKVISMAAHMVASTIFPGVFAQNEADEEDKTAEKIMRYLVEWNIRNSDYELTFLYSVIAALVNPAAYLESSFNKTLQTIKARQANGEITTEEIVDEIISGFEANIVPADEIFIANPYEFKIQKQRFLIRKRFIDYDTAKQLFGKHENFQYVNLGIRPLFDPETAQFYDQRDEELMTLVEWEIYYNRLEDTEVSFLNGIYMGDKNVLSNPIKHRDNRNRPKYPYAKFGFEPIDEKRFFFYKSLVAKMADDQDLVDEMWRLTIDGTFLELFPPLATTGGEKLDSAVIFPGKVTNFGKETTTTEIGKGRNLVAGVSALREIENSMNQSSQAEIREGQLSRGDKTAFEIRRAEINASIVQFGVFGRMMSQVIKDFGELMIDDIITHQTVAEVEEVLGGEMKMKFRTYLLPNQNEDGKEISRKIIFDKELIGKKRNKEERLMASFKIIKEQGGIESDQRIYRVNPTLFAKLKFQIFIEPDVFPAKSAGEQKLEKLAAYDKMMTDPNANQRAIARDFLYEPFAPGNSEKYMLEKEEMPPALEQLLMMRGQKGPKQPMPQSLESETLRGVLQKTPR